MTYYNIQEQIDLLLIIKRGGDDLTLPHQRLPLLTLQSNVKELVEELLIVNTHWLITHIPPMGDYAGKP